MSTADLFSLAPAFLAAYLLVALASPAICARLGRAGLLLLAALPAATSQDEPTQPADAPTA